ncbi:MAG: tyrosine-type recombinase/integrase [Eubacterium sp.]|nr:tyrosine-type recombinase/integrase [Eubacterium sp.]
MGRVARKYPTGGFFLRTPAKVDEDKLYPVYLYYFCGGKKLRQSTSVLALAKDWNQKANHGIGELRASYGPDYRKKNLQLQKMLRKIDGSIFDYVEMNGEISPDIIQGFICGDDRPLRADKGRNFVAYALELLEKQYMRRKIRISTYKNSVSILNQFKNFLSDKECGQKGELFVGNITEDIVRDFLSWGLERGRKTDTVEKYLETISKICRQASDNGFLCKASAQAITDIALEENLDDSLARSIKYLTTVEIGKLVNIDRSIISNKQADVLEMFKFSYLSCGPRISDIITLRWCDIDFEKKELCKIQVKTRGRNIIPLTDEALKILEEWKGRHNVFVFGLLSDNFDLKDEVMLRTRRNSITKSINNSLESISKKAQLEKKVTFHMARHSWAVSALEQGMSISMISSLLGHTSTAITEKVYAEFRQEAKVEAVRNLKLII